MKGDALRKEPQKASQDGKPLIFRKFLPQKHRWINLFYIVIDAL